MHEVFSAVRVWQLHHAQSLPGHAEAAALRLYGPDRWADAMREASATSYPRESLQALCFSILHSGPYYDDPSDTVRTLSNMEVSTIRYIDERLPNMPDWPVWVQDLKRPDTLIGIEQVFDCILHYADHKIIRVIGTIDGLTLSRHKNRHFLEENKTASRLDDGWRQSFELTHQITGYMACSTTIFGFPVNDCHVYGLKLRQSGYGDDVLDFFVERDANAILRWAAWVRWTVETLYEPYAVTHTDGTTTPDFERAPMFTHSCNRYFRPCSLVPFCTDTPEGRAEQWDQMVPAALSPSEQAIADRTAADPKSR